LLGDARKIKESIIIVNLLTAGSLLKLQLMLTDVSGLKHRRRFKNPTYQILEINKMLRKLIPIMLILV
jgi:hypothetical protein